MSEPEPGQPPAVEPPPDEPEQPPAEGEGEDASAKQVGGSDGKDIMSGAVKLEFGDGDDDDESSELDAGADANGGEPETHGRNQKPADKNLCLCCGEEPREEKTSFGKECKKAINNIERKEAKETNKQGDRWNQWQEIKRKAGPALTAIVMSYFEECGKSQGSGNKRGTEGFDFAYHYERLESRAIVKTGEKLVYMPLTKWLKIAQKDHGLTAAVAKKQWEKKEKSLPKAQHKKNANDVLLLPMPSETFIVGANSQEHIKGMQLQGKTHKKPTEKQVQNMEKHVTSGHFGFSDQAFAKVGGGDLVNNAHTGLSLAFAPDGDSLFGDGANFRDAILASFLH